MADTLNGPNGLNLILDEDQINNEDPGQGTPALVTKTVDGEEHCGSFNCAVNTGEIDGLVLSDDEIEWLNEQAETVDEFLSGDDDDSRPELEPQPEDSVEFEPHDSMDGDHDSAMASAGYCQHIKMMSSCFGTDEDYGYFGGGDE